MNPVLECLFKHRSIRRYKDQPVEDEKIQLIIKAAQAAPNWCNGQQVSIIAVKDKERKNRIQKYCGDQKYIGTCSVFLVFCSDFYRISLAFEKDGKSKESFQKYITHIDPVIIGSHDVGIALQNAVVAAESLGLGTVDIGGVRINSIELAKELKLPKYVIPVVGLCVGYADGDPGLKPRLPMNSVFFNEQYDTEKAKAGIDEYDETYKKYLADRGSNTRDSNWSKSISDIYTQLGNPDQDYPLLKQQGYISIDKK